MTEMDDKMLKQFFNDNKNEVEDNGFSERVMSHLPGKAQRLAKLWTLISFLLAITLFVILGCTELHIIFFMTIFAAGKRLTI